MYIRQKELFANLDQRFVKEIMEITEKKTYEKGTLIFREGSHASRLYLLVKGRVELTVGPTRQLAFTVTHAGEAFGWSSLLGRTAYAASAVSAEPTEVHRIDRVKLNMVLSNNPSNGLILIRHLAEILGHRLHEAYKMIAAGGEVSESYGTGQVMQITPAG